MKGGMLGKITIADYVIDPDAVVWANLYYSLGRNVGVYIEKNGVKTVQGYKTEAQEGVYLRFVDGSHLFVPEPHAEKLREYLVGNVSRVGTPGDSSVAEILAGLPAELRALGG